MKKLLSVLLLVGLSSSAAFAQCCSCGDRPNPDGRPCCQCRVSDVDQTLKSTSIENAKVSFDKLVASVQK